MYNDAITLLTETVTINTIGDMVTTTVSTNVFAKVKSIGMKEAYEAMSVGLKPELCFVLADYLDYNNQELIQYNSVTYKVLRTYRGKSNELEIVVTR